MTIRRTLPFLLKQGRSWHLAPAYDVTHAYNPKGKWTYQHLMSVNGRFEHIARTDLLEVADRFGVRKPQDALADVVWSLIAGLILRRMPDSHLLSETRWRTIFVPYESAGKFTEPEFWLPPRDSNPDRLLQRQLSYH